MMIAAARLVAAFSVMASLPASGADFFVDSMLDQIDIDGLDGVCLTVAGTCTLRAAVMQANRSPGPSTIHLPAGTYLLTRPPDAADGDDSGDLNFVTISSSDPEIGVIGAGAAQTVIDAGGLDRVMRVDEGRILSLAYLTLRNGVVSGSGGGLICGGTRCTLDRVEIRDNHADFGSGGGVEVLSDSLLEAYESTFRGNSTTFFGGGLYVEGTAHVESSTIRDNEADLGGGILSQGTLRLVDSTVSGNVATASGGGLWADAGTADLYSSTIVANRADGSGGGGVQAATGVTLNLRNCLLAGNVLTGTAAFTDCSGTVHSYGRNLFSDFVDCTVVTGSGAWGLLNGLAFLAPLASNSGPTATHALLSGSNAIDGGDPVLGCQGPTGLLVTDQRGQPRASGVRCDVGAFEFGPLVFSDSFESGDVDAWSSAVGG